MSLYCFMIRLGLFRCPSCGTYYDPTNGACPGCSGAVGL